MTRLRPSTGFISPRFSDATLGFRGISVVHTLRGSVEKLKARSLEMRPKRCAFAGMRDAEGAVARVPGSCLFITDSSNTLGARRECAALFWCAQQREEISAMVRVDNICIELCTKSNRVNSFRVGRGNAAAPESGRRTQPIRR